MIRWLSLVLVVGVLASACTGSNDPESTPPSSTGETGSETAADDAVGATVATTPPVILGVVVDLALAPGQCFSELPTPQPSTSVPQPESIAVVDCAGSSLGLAYSNGCLAVEPSDSPELVIEIPCPGRADDRWPGLRELAPAAVSACLPQFEAAVGERFSTSELEAVELLPSEQLWALGERRFVCTAQKTLSGE